MLVILEIIILVAGYFVTSELSIGFYFREAALLSLFFALIAAISLIIFFRGQSKSPESQTMHSLVAVSLKFLLELFLVFIWFFLAKKTGLSSVLLFFVLYLTFTLFLIFIILKTLKSRSL